jgi:hypothetical protein
MKPVRFMRLDLTFLKGGHDMFTLAMRAVLRFGVCGSLIAGALSFYLFPAQTSASTINVTVTGGFRNGVTLISIIDGASLGVTINVNEPGSSDGTIASGSTNAAGTYTSGVLAPGLTIGASSVDITIAAEHFRGITTTGNYTSAEQVAGAPKVFGTFDGLPFDFLGSFVDVGGTLFGQLQLFNNSTQFAFDFTSLDVYTGLDLSFFNSTDFASASAIASGALAYDFIALNGGGASIPLAGGAASSILTFPAGPLASDRYILLTGNARPILGPGQFGTPTEFAIAAAAVPEPSTLMLLITGVAGMIGYGLRRKAVA